MIRKLTFMFFALLVLLVSIAALLIFVPMRASAGSHKMDDYTTTPNAPDNAITQTVASQADDIPVTAYTVYLPAIFNRFCSMPLSFNEVIRYNLAIIGIEEAWQNCSYGDGIVVAVVDTGIDLDHPDLQANIVSGRNFVGGTSPNDDVGHGTHVAGIIAAVSNNGGVIGVAPAVSLMPVKALDSTGGYVYNIASGIEWATDNGADIINLSLGGVLSSETLQTAVAYAYDRGVLLVASGGNCGDANYLANSCYYQDQPVYPAAYGNVMAVASTTSLDTQSSFSNQGWYIEIAAPGSYVYSTYLNGSYAYLSGTSMAAPHVAGLAALIWAQNRALTNAQVRSQIDNTAHDLGSSGWDSQFGYGRIDSATATSGLLQISGATVPVGADPTASKDTAAEYRAGEVLFKLRDDVAINQVITPAQLAAAEVQVLDTIDQLGVQRLAVPAGQEQSWLTQLRNSDGIEYAELNYRVTIQ